MPDNGFRIRADSPHFLSLHGPEKPDSLDQVRVLRLSLEKRCKSLK
ncbi:MAG: hypothetical protein QNL11_00885 [Desulfobacterales bacterium]|nr:hypothetical protein [Deltaproteobacteria bacterium]MDX2496437.1 hypothetical protein [Desulfobacterales bacterium]